MNANAKWDIEIRDIDGIIGSSIPATGWDVLSKLAAVKAAIPANWTAEAYPQITVQISPNPADIPVMRIPFPPK